MSKSSEVGTLLQVAAAAAAVAATFATGGLAGVSAAAFAKTAFVLSAASAVQASSYARNKARAAYNASVTDRTIMTSTYAGARSRCYGRVRNVDGVLFKATRGDKSQFYTLVVALAGHEIDGVEQVYFNDTPVTLDASGRVVTEPYGYTTKTPESRSVSGVSSFDVGSDAILSSVQVWGEAGNRSYRIPFTVSGTVISWTDTAKTIKWQRSVQQSKATVRVFNGSPGQDLSGELSSRFPGLINSSHKFAGIACLLVDLEFDENAFTIGVPSISARFRGATVYDPRSGVTAWSENPALCARDWALYANGGDCDTDEIDGASFTAAANACDVSHTYTDSNGVSSTVALFRCAYVAKLDVSPEAHFAELVESMGGRWAWAGGRLRVRAGVYSAPVASVDESWLSNASGGIQIVPEVGVHELVNSYRITIADQSQNSVATQLPVLAPSSYLAADGFEAAEEIEMGAVPFGPQALHIAGVMLRDQRDGMTVVWPCNMRAWPIEVFDVISVSSTRYGWTNKQFEVLGWARSLAGGVTLTLKETGSSIYNPDAVFSAVDQIANTNLPKPWDLPVITGLAVQSGTNQLLVGADGSIITRAQLTFNPVLNQSVLTGGVIEVGWSDGGEFQFQEFPGSSTQIYVNGLRDGAYYVFTARCKNKLASGDWCLWVPHTVIGKTEKPPTVDSFTIDTQTDGTRILRGGYTAANRPVDLAGYRIRYRQGTGPFTWASMTPFQTDTGFFTTFPIETNQLLAGTYTLSVVGVDTTGNESETPLSIVVTLPNPRLGNALQVYDYLDSGWPGTLSNGVSDTESGSLFLRAADQATWATLPATWSAWTRWVWNPYTSWSYTTPAADFGAVVQTLPVVSLDVVGSYVVEEQHSSDGSTWTSWATLASPFNARYVKLRVTVTATGATGAGVTQITRINAMSVIYTGKVTSETGNDINPASLTGANRIGTGDIRLPLSRSYASISRVYIALQNVTGNWSWSLEDKSTAGPRIKFYNSSGVLADPPLIDFTVEGIAS